MVLAIGSSIDNDVGGLWKLSSDCVSQCNKKMWNKVEHGKVSSFRQ